MPVTGGRKHPQAETIKIDTSNILFICGGAFDGIDKIIGKEETHNSIGFGANVADKKESVADLSKVEQHDLVKYGLMPELIGRLPIITALNPLSEEDLVHILTEPKNAITKQYQELLSMDGVKLEFEDEALRKIAELAIQKKTGARGLRSIIESAMQKVMFDVPDMASAKKVVVTADCVEGKADALVYGARNKKITFSLSISHSISVALFILFTSEIMSLIDLTSISKNSKTLTSRAAAIFSSCSSLGFLLSVSYFFIVERLMPLFILNCFIVILRASLYFLIVLARLERSLSFI